MQRALFYVSIVSILLAAVWGSRVSSTGDVSSLSAARATAATSPSIDITVGATPERQTELDSAVEVFSSNGLDLPDLDVRFFDDPVDCNGHPGLFFDEVKPRRVLICSELSFVLPHELAHAWASYNLDDADRARYTEARGFETWDDKAADWSDRGTEDAAFIIQQNLRGAEVSQTSSAWLERMATYELLTGQTSPLRRQEPVVG